MCSSNAASGGLRPNTQADHPRTRTAGEEIRNESVPVSAGGPPRSGWGAPSCCSSFTAAGTSVGAIPPPSLRWSLVQALPYGCVCVSGSAAVVWWWWGGSRGGGGGAACTAVGMCLEEIRKTKNTEALDDSGYSCGGGGLPAAALIHRKHNPAQAGLKLRGKHSDEPGPTSQITSLDCRSCC